MTDESCTEFDVLHGNMGEAEKLIIPEEKRPSSETSTEETRQIRESNQTKNLRAISERKFKMVQCNCKNECKKLGCRSHRYDKI